jgi:hypothetical protein
MWFSSDHRGICIFIRGEFVAPGQWLIRATAASASGDTAGSAASRRRTVGELWRGIKLEGRVGRRLGAISVRVVVDGDADIARMFASTANPEELPQRAPLKGHLGWVVHPIERDVASA